MTLLHDREFQYVVLGILGVLVLASVLGWALSRRVTTESGRKVVDNLNARTRAWWMMCIVLIGALATGGLGSVLIFGLSSFLALREFITLTPTRRGDHRTLFWAFFVFIPYQYYLVHSRWEGMFFIFIPVYVFLFVPVRSALAGDTTDFLARTARIQWGLMICVYCVSHAPALLMLDIPGFEGQSIKLLMYLVIIAQASDVLQYVFGKTLGRHKVVPKISPNKTWEGLIGGVGATVGLGAGLWWFTPFSPGAAALISLAIALAGFCGGLCMSAIKRDVGIKDFGSLIEGHGGVLDRIDSICFAAPLFFHIVRYYYIP